MSLQLQLLGQPRITINADSPIHLPAKAIALLGYLAATNTPQRRDHLLALLWAESGDDAARKNLRNMLWQIRRNCGTDAIITSADRLSLNPQTQVDLWQIQAWLMLDHADLVAKHDAILALNRGSLLDGMTVSEAPDFELWLTTERERWTIQYSRLLTNLLHEQQRRHAWQAVSDIAHALIQLDHLAEPAYQALIEAHAQRGERAEALRWYDLLATVLERELGVAPLPESQAVRQQIMDNRTIPAVMPDVAPAPLVARPAPTPFVGRQHEFQQLDIALAHSKTQGVQIALLTGDIGIGKSRLWHEWSSQQTSQQVLTMHCLESTKTLPFAPLTDVFRHAHDHIRSLPTLWLSEVARLLPELRLQMPNLPVPPALPPDEERRRLFEALTQYVMRLLNGGLIIGIDDLQWADQATAEWLDYALHRLQNAPLLVGATYRAEEASPHLQRLIAKWQRDGLIRRINVERLNDHEVAQLLDAVGHRCDASTIQAQSAGNPLYVLELSRAASSDVPPLLVDVIKNRLANLPAAAGQIVQAAAVLDPLWNFATLRSTAGRSEEETLDGLDALLHARIVQENGTHYTFSHPLVAAVVLQDLSGARRAFLNRRAAQTLEREYAGRLAPIAGRLLSHYRAADEPIKAAYYADLAAEHAMLLAAPAEAHAFRAAALDLEPTPLRQTALGEVLQWLGDLPGARAAYTAALSDHEHAGAWQSVADAYIRLALIDLAEGRPQATITAVETARSIIEQHGLDAPVISAHSLMLLGVSQRQAGYPLDLAQRMIEAAITLARHHNVQELLGQGLLELGNVLAQRGDVQGAITTFEQAIERGQAHNNVFQLVLAYNNAAYNCTLIGNAERAHGFIAHGLNVAETWGLRVPFQYLYSTRGEIALLEQHWDEATAWFERGLVEAQSNANLPQIANYHANLALAARGRGEVAAAIKLLQTAQHEVATLTTPYLTTQIHLWLAETWLMHGDHAAAWAALDHAQQTIGQEQGFLQHWHEQVKMKLLGEK